MRRRAAISAVTRRLPAIPGAHRVADALGRLAPGPACVTLHGAPVALDPADDVERMLLFAPHLYERREQAALRAALRPGDVFLDLGAHLGLYARLAAGIVGETGRVVAVEPDPRTAERLRLPGVTVVEAGLSDTDGYATLGPAEAHNGGGRSLLKPGGPVVRTRTVPSLLAELGLRRVDAAKLDLEGLEFRALSAWLPHGPRPRWLLFEHHPALVPSAGGDTLELLRDHGYRIRRLSRHNYAATG